MARKAQTRVSVFVCAPEYFRNCPGKLFTVVAWSFVTYFMVQLPRMSIIESHGNVRASRARRMPRRRNVSTTAGVMDVREFPHFI